MLIKKIYILLLILCVPLTWTMEAPKENNVVPEKISHNTLRGIVITPENLYELSIKLPSHLHKDLEKALSIPENYEIITTLLDFKKCSDVQEFYANEKAQKEYIKNKNINNHSIWNFIFCLPNSNAMIRIAGPRNALATKRATLYNIPRPLTEEKLKEKGATWLETTTTPVATFQHTSCVAVYGRLAEIAPFFKHVTFIPTYLYPLTQDPQAIGSDNNYITIQKKYEPNVIFEIKELSTEEKTEIMNNLPDLAFKELFCAIHAGPLWNLGVDTNLMIEKGKNQTVIVGDFEQPNDTNGNDFFNRGKEGFEAYKYHAKTGMAVMLKSLQDYAPAKAPLWQDICQQDPSDVLQELKKTN